MLKLDLFLAPLLALAGLVGPGWLGVLLGEDDHSRPMVTEVVPDSPAAKAGVKAGDVVLAVGDTKVSSVEGLVDAVKALSSGTKVRIQLERNGKAMGIDVVLGERPADISMPVRRAVERAGAEEGEEKAEMVEESKPKTGAAPAARGPAGRPFLGVALEEAQGGVQISEVVAGGPAAKAGVEPGRLLSIGSTKIASLADVDKAMSALRPGQAVQVAVREGQDTEKYSVTLGGQGAGARARQETAEAGAKAKSEAEDEEREDEKREAAEREAKREANRAAARAKAESERIKARADKAKAEAEKIKASAEKTKAAAEKTKAAAEKTKAAAEKVKAAAKDSARQPAIARAVTPGSASDSAEVLRELRGKQPLVLVFGAAWDANSKAMRKSFDDEAVKKALGDRRVLWFDTDKHGRVADEFGVQNLPHTVLLQADGKRAGVVEGYQPPEILAEKLRVERRGGGRPVERAPDSGEVEGRKGDRKPGDNERPGDRDLQAEIRQLREEIRELRGMLRELMRERRR